MPDLYLTWEELEALDGLFDIVFHEKVYSTSPPMDYYDMEMLRQVSEKVDWELE